MPEKKVLQSIYSPQITGILYNSNFKTHQELTALASQIMKRSYFYADFKEMKGGNANAKKQMGIIFPMPVFRSAWDTQIL